MWLDSLNPDHGFVRQEKNALSISFICREANTILAELSAGLVDRSRVVELIRRMHTLDSEATRWRQRPEWSFAIKRVEDIQGYRNHIDGLPMTLHLNKDLWLVYEWNYHRTARIILHQQLLACVAALNPGISAASLEIEDAELMAWKETSSMTVEVLAEEVLSTVPQSFGDVDHLGRCTASSSSSGDYPRPQAIGAYLLLWPIKIIKSNDGASTDIQKKTAGAVFERIRECTGMKNALGSLSII